jgi:hypothetical protein
MNAIFHRDELFFLGFPWRKRAEKHKTIRKVKSCHNFFLSSCSFILVRKLKQNSGGMK